MPRADSGRRPFHHMDDCRSCLRQIPIFVPHGKDEHLTLCATCTAKRFGRGLVPEIDPLPDRYADAPLPRGEYDRNH